MLSLRFRGHSKISEYAIANFRAPTITDWATSGGAERDWIEVWKCSTYNLSFSYTKEDQFSGLLTSNMKLVGKHTDKNGIVCDLTLDSLFPG